MSKYNQIVIEEKQYHSPDCNGNPFWITRSEAKGNQCSVAKYQKDCSVKLEIASNKKANAYFCKLYTEFYHVRKSKKIYHHSRVALY